MKYISTIRLDLLDLFGRTYVLEHCINAVREDTEIKAFRLYVTDLLKSIAESFGAEVRYRYADIISTERRIHGQVMK